MTTINTTEREGGGMDPAMISAELTSDRRELDKLEMEHDRLECEVTEIKHEIHGDELDNLRRKYEHLRTEVKEGGHMNGIVPVISANGGNTNDGWMAMLAMLGLLGGGFNNRRGDGNGCCETLGLSNQIASEGRNTTNAMLTSDNMLNNAYNFGTLTTNMATGFGNMNTNMATVTGALGDKVDMNATRLAEATAQTAAEIRNVRDGQFALSQQAAADTLALSRELCAMGRMSDQQFNQVQMAIMAGDNATARDIAKCCCETQRAIDGVKFEGERNTAALSRQLSECCCDLKGVISAGNQRILDQMSADKIQCLRDERDALRFQLSQNTQNSQIVGSGAGIAAGVLAALGNTAGAGAAGAGIAGAASGVFNNSI